MKKNGLRAGLSVVASAVLLGACTSGSGEKAKTLKGEVEVKALDLANVDSTVNPTDDFFRFANGKWLDRTEIPSDKGRWGSFMELRENTDNTVLGILKSAEEGGNLTEGSDQAKAVEFYKVGMDSLLAEKVGISPLETYFKQINDIKDKKDLQAYLGKQEVYGIGSYFGIFVMADLKNSDVNALYIGAGGIGLPDRDYYTKTDDKSKETRAEYLKHVIKMLELTGEVANTADANAKVIMDMETQMAQSMLTKEERRDPNKIYNKMSISDLSKLTPSIDWNAYLNTVGVKGVKEVIVSQPAYMQEVEKVFNKFSMDDIKAYLKWHLIHSTAGSLDSKFVAESFNFYGKYLGGKEEMSARWKRVLAATNGTLGEAVGQLYVDQVFPPEAKENAVEMVQNIIDTYKERIQNLEWMSEDTKKMAQKKLDFLTVKIGYPDSWKDYSKLEVSDKSYIENVLNSRKFRHEENMEKIGKPVDKAEWHMNPQTVNAYYNPTSNEIVFPAAILQPPFYNYKADAAVNYGGIGGVIGHEISHGFDDQGSRFDETGNLKNWWTEEDYAQFNKRTAQLVEQYDAYEPVEGAHVSGQFTLGENIGDLGGITAAYFGLQKYFDKHGKPENIDGLTPEQRFFMSWATIWRSKAKDEYLRTQVNTDPHSPAMFRANGPLTDFEAFYEAFEVKEGDQMYRPDSLRVEIW
ncbi:M13 family metallopeptidase [Xanthovirga aplysinae]|uniref:M13 family metallopeptidase n=1 Tax=Xanthovirga aplysinae TaxID=2529853 RepID=UPI0012BD76CB|nr:M13 family metallopeptidase [Xanthovirga aplysinae]MTI29780.1 M13 family peptidase [Xanthovirga aplysinae]